MIQEQYQMSMMGELKNFLGLQIRQQIQICHHFLRDHVNKQDIDIIHVNTEEQLADIFTKPLDEKMFCKLWCELNILESSNVM